MVVRGLGDPPRFLGRFRDVDFTHDALDRAAGKIGIGNRRSTARRYCSRIRSDTVARRVAR